MTATPDKIIRMRVISATEPDPEGVEVFVSVTRDDGFLKESDKIGPYYRLRQPLNGRPDVFPDTVAACSTRQGTAVLAEAITPDLWSWCRVAVIARKNDREACTVLFGGHFTRGGIVWSAGSATGEFVPFGWLDLMSHPFYRAARDRVLARLEAIVERDDPWDVVPLSERHSEPVPPPESLR